jgi:hypothetical protein
MTSLKQAFDAFVNKVAPDAGQQEQHSKRSQRLVEILKSEWGPDKVLRIGSVGRGTNIAPTHDVDWMVVLDKTKFEEADAAKVLGEVRDSLQHAYSEGTLRVQNRSVGLDYPDFGIDVVPAVSRAKGGYHIPDVKAGKWIYTDPPKHTELVTEKNLTTDRMAAGLVRTLKVWNRKAGMGLKSFHLEVMTLRGIEKKPESFAQGVRDAFKHVAGAVTKSCGDPAQSGNVLDAYLDGVKRSAIAKACEDAAKVMELAIAEDARGDSGVAVNRVRELLGGPF